MYMSRGGSKREVVFDRTVMMTCSYSDEPDLCALSKNFVVLCNDAVVGFDVATRGLASGVMHAMAALACLFVARAVLPASPALSM